MYGVATGGAPKCSGRTRAQGLPHRRDHDRRAAQAARLRHRDHRQVAPGAPAAVPADASGVRLLVRPAVLARHADDRAARQRLQNARLLRAETGILGRAADEERRRDRAAGRSPDADEALHRGGASSSSRPPGSAVLPLPGAQPAAHPARALRRVRRPQQRRDLRRCRRGARREHGPDPRCAHAQPASTGARWSSSPATTGRGFRSRRTAGSAGPLREGQGDDLGRRRADAGDLLVAWNGQARPSSRTSAPRWTCSPPPAQPGRRGAAARSRQSMASI